MFSLVISVIAIALIVAVSTAGINYIDWSATTRHAATMKTQTGFHSLVSGFLSYRMDKGYPLPVLNWEAELTPNYAKIPSPPFGAWSYAKDTGGYWFCLSGEASKAQYTGLLRVRENVSADAYYVAESCGATVDMVEPVAFPVTAAATYWVQ